MQFLVTKNFKVATHSKGDKNSEKLALVLPGRLDTKDYAHMRSHVDFMASEGYYALSFDVPGTWESPGNLADYTTSLYIKIVKEIIDHFSRPTILIGHSRGGTVSMLVGAEHPKVIATVMIMATYGPPTPASPEAVKLGYQNEPRDLPGYESKTDQPKIYKLPMNYFVDGQKQKPVDMLKNSSKPKLLIYGTDDPYTTPEKVEQIFASIPKPKMLHKVNCDHDYRYHAEIIEDVNQAIGKFLKTFVK